MSQLSRSPRVRVLGVMTGTSCDALDASCVEINRDGWKMLWSKTVSYPSELRRRVFEVQKPGVRFSLRDLLCLDRDLGEWFGRTIASMIRGERGGRLPHLVASHGQTVCHIPAPKRQGVTLQLGDPARIAFLTGKTVVASFRSGDMSAGGEGAPLVPLFHKILASNLRGRDGGDPGSGLSIHNIGGISNLTFIGPDGRVVAFDTGPGNMWIDAAVELMSRGSKKMDQGGRLAMRGVVDEAAVRKLLRHPFLRKKPPKSTGRDEFPFELLLAATKARGLSLIATATAITVESIADAYERLVMRDGRQVSEVFVCGGGAKNAAIMGGLSKRLPEVEFTEISKAGLDPAYIEAQAFAMFGFMSLMGHPLGGTWTGVNKFGPPAHIVPGENWKDVLRLARLFF